MDALQASTVPAATKHKHLHQLKQNMLALVSISGAPPNGYWRGISAVVFVCCERRDCLSATKAGRPATFSVLLQIIYANA